VPMFVSNCHAFKPPVSEVYLLDVGSQTAFWFSLFPEAPHSSIGDFGLRQPIKVSQL
jgi:hypothetical protein